MIFGLARTGSTTLLNVVRLNKTVRCAKEPFNPDEKFYQFDKIISNEKDLFNAMEFLYATNEGIKHTFDFFGFPFADPALNRSMLLHGGNIVFLRRRNILQRIVSCQISMQTKVWEFSAPDDRESITNFRFQPLPIDVIRSYVENEANAMEDFKNFMLQRSIPFIEIYYEDIFGSDLALNDRLERIDQILSFVGLPPTSNFPRTALENLLSQDNKMSPTDLYNNIPNFEEIEHNFGSSETGWLFK